MTTTKQGTLPAMPTSELGDICDKFLEVKECFDKDKASLEGLSEQILMFLAWEYATSVMHGGHKFEILLPVKNR